MIDQAKPKKNIRAFLLPQLIGAEKLVDHVVVIDVLRASTTICAALANGASSIVPFLDIAETKQFATANQTALTGGERGGVQIGDFDFGNSPLEYSPDRVTGRPIAFTTTNGTKAMTSCRDCESVFIGAFCNFTRIVTALSNCNQFDLVCSGTHGEITLEDCAFAGMVVDYFSGSDAQNINDQAEICRQLWQNSKSDLTEALKKSTGGANLCLLGKDDDVEFAAKIDSLPILPKLDTKVWKIEPA